MVAFNRQGFLCNHSTDLLETKMKWWPRPFSMQNRESSLPENETRPSPVRPRTSKRPSCGSTTPTSLQPMYGQILISLLLQSIFRRLHTFQSWNDWSQSQSPGIACNNCWLFVIQWLWWLQSANFHYTFLGESGAMQSPCLGFFTLNAVQSISLIQKINRAEKSRKVTAWTLARCE